jgi:hypothetical protein
MANNRKTEIRVFTIADYEEEEVWLREQHRQGWKLVSTNLPVFYHFVRCEPEDVVYRLDYKNSKEDRSYMQMFEDYGWEYFNDCIGWLYFRKPAADMDSDMEEEIFSDNESKLEFLNHIIKTRMIPLLIIFFLCLLPQWLNVIDRSMDAGIDVVLFVIFSLLMLIYLYLFIHCGRKMLKLRKKYKNCYKKIIL